MQNVLHLRLPDAGGFPDAGGNYIGPRKLTGMAGVAVGQESSSSSDPSFSMAARTRRPLDLAAGAGAASSSLSSIAVRPCGAETRGW